MMKEIALTLGLLAGALLSVSARDVKFVEHASPTDDYFYGVTHMSDSRVKFATYQQVNGGQKVTFILLDKDLNEVKRFTINTFSYKPDEYSEEQWSRPSYVYNVQTGCDEYIATYLVSDHLFNNDDLTEVLLRTGDSAIIYNEKGDKLGVYPKGNFPKLYSTPEMTYFSDGYRMLWSVEGVNSRIREVTDASESLDLSPNPVAYDSTVTVTLPAEMTEGGSVAVFDTEGRKLHYGTFEVGETKVQIPAYRLASGVNLVNVISTDNEIVAIGKIIRE